MRCQACGADLPDGASYCIQCGVHLDTGMRADGDAPDSEIYPLLAAANLFRMRGNWDAAEQKCIEVLRLYPNNATAHSLLGDIYANQDRWDEAIQWYQLAVDLDPDNGGDRAKLGQARGRLAGAEALARAVPDNLPRAPGEAKGQRLAPPMQLAVIGMATFVVVLFLISIWSKPHRQDTAAEPLRTELGVGVALPGSRGFGAAQQPQSAAPGTPPAASGNLPAANGAVVPPGNTPAAPPAVANSAAATTNPQPPGPDMSEPEARTLARLQSQVPLVSHAGQGRLADLRWDPLNRGALVTVLFTRTLEPAALRDEALRAAYRAGQALGRVGIDRFEVIVKAPLPGGHGAGIAFAAQTENARAATWNGNAETARPEALLTAFSNVWWHAQLH